MPWGWLLRWLLTPNSSPHHEEKIRLLFVKWCCAHCDGDFGAPSLPVPLGKVLFCPTDRAGDGVQPGKNLQSQGCAVPEPCGSLGTCRAAPPLPGHPFHCRVSRVSSQQHSLRWGECPRRQMTGKRSGAWQEEAAWWEIAVAGGCVCSPRNDGQENSAEQIERAHV